MAADHIKDLCDLLEGAGATIAFGLRQQGKLDIVTDMIADGASWEEIGRAIGWCPKAARRDWLWHVKNPRPWLWRKEHGEPPPFERTYQVAVLDTASGRRWISTNKWSGASWIVEIAFDPDQIYAYRPMEEPPDLEAPTER